MKNVIRIDDERTRNDRDLVVRGSLVVKLNPLYEAEANWRCNAHERSKRVETLDRQHERKLHVKAGEVRRFEPRSIDYLGMHVSDEPRVLSVLS
jgi:hypothetical protein